MARSKKRAVFVLLVCLCMSATVFAGDEQSVLALFNLRPTNFDAMGYNSDILYAVVSALEKNKSIDVLPRREMEALLSQAGLAQSDNRAHVIKAGNAIGASFVFYGSVTKTGPIISADLHLLDVRQQKVVQSWSPSFSRAEAIKSEIDSLARELAMAISKTGAGMVSPPVTAAQEAVGVENLAVKAQDKQVIISWRCNSIQPVAGFNVYRASNPQGPYQFQGRTIENTYTDERVQSGRHYHYRLGLLAPNGRESMCPLTADIKFTGEKVPHPPLIMSASGHIRRVVIEFVPSLQNVQAKFKITGYEIYRRSASDSVWKPIFSMDAGMRSKSKLGFSVEDQQIDTDGATLTYAIKSIDHKQSESALSDPVSVQTPLPPELHIAGDNQLRRVEFTWRPVTQALGYYLFRKTDQTDWQRVAEIKGADQAAYTDNLDLDDDTVYHYHLTAYDQGAQTGKSNIVKAHTKARPPIPADLQVVSGLVKSARVSWTPIDDPDIGGYVIYRGTDAGDLAPIDKVKGYQTGTFVDKGKFLPSFGALLKKGQLFTSLEDGQTYFYAVAGINLFGGEGERSATVSARTKPRPPPVPVLKASSAPGQILLHWEQSAAADIASYKIFRSKNNNGWDKVETVSAGQNSYRDTDLKSEIEYRYRIVAEDQDGLESDPVESNRILSPVPKAEG